MIIHFLLTIILFEITMIKKGMPVMDSFCNFYAENSGMKYFYSQMIVNDNYSASCCSLCPLSVTDILPPTAH